MFADLWIEKEGKKSELVIPGFDSADRDKIILCIVVLLIEIPHIVTSSIISVSIQETLFASIIYMLPILLFLCEAIRIQHRKTHTILNSLYWALAPIGSVALYLALWHITPCLLSFFWHDENGFMSVSVPAAFAAICMIVLLFLIAEAALEKDPVSNALRVLLSSIILFVLQFVEWLEEVGSYSFSEWDKTFFGLITWVTALVAIYSAAHSYRTIKCADQ